MLYQANSIPLLCQTSLFLGILIANFQVDVYFTSFKLYLQMKVDLNTLTFNVI